MRTSAYLVFVAALSLQLVAGKSAHLAGKANSVVASSGHRSAPASSSHGSSAQHSSPGPSPETSAGPAPEPNGNEQAPDNNDDQGDNQDYGGGYGNQQAYDEATTTILQYDGAATANTVNDGNPVATLGSCPDYTVTITNQVYATLVTTITPTWLAMPTTP